MSSPLPRPHPADCALHIKGLRVRLGSTEVLRGVDMHVPKGELVALIGPNGCGKTTLLRCLLGLQRIDAGEVRLLGEPPGPHVLRRIGYVPQRLQLDRSFILSVREFLALRLSTTRNWFWQSRRKTDDALKQAIGEFGIMELLDRPVAGLSGGQLQRLLITSSLLNEPELLLLDEPTAGVDTPGEASFYELIAEIHRRRRLTMVLVSHDLGMVFQHASWVFALNGVICCQGRPDQVLDTDSLKAAYGLHVTSYHHNHQPAIPAEAPIQFRSRDLKPAPTPDLSRPS